MRNKKTIIDIKGIITKVNGEEFTEQEYDNFTDDFLQLLESKSYCFGGGFIHCSEKEYLEKD